MRDDRALTVVSLNLHYGERLVPGQRIGVI